MISKFLRRRLCKKTFATLALIALPMAAMVGCATQQGANQGNTAAKPVSEPIDTRAGSSKRVKAVEELEEQGASASETSPAAIDSEAEQFAHAAKVDSINEQIAVEATRQADAKKREAIEEYRLGTGDIIDVTVFQVDELTRQYRINADGTVIFPLLGSVKVGGRSSVEVENELEEILGREYLQDPQVAVFIAQYQSQQITVMGSVNEPAVHSINEPKSILDVLSMSGGLAPDAGGRLYVERTDFDDDGNEGKVSLIVDVEAIVDPTDTSRNLLLRGGDSIFVPKAGVVFVEGEVNQPGAYPLQSETTVLKAIALAGGTARFADEGDVQVLRSIGAETEIYEVSIEDIKENEAADIALQDGDIVVVDTNVSARTWSGFWRGLTGIVGFSKGF